MAGSGGRRDLGGFAGDGSDRPGPGDRSDAAVPTDIDAARRLSGPADDEGRRARPLRGVRRPDQWASAAGALPGLDEGFRLALRALLRALLLQRELRCLLARACLRPLSGHVTRFPSIGWR